MRLDRWRVKKTQRQVKKVSRTPLEQPRESPFQGWLLAPILKCPPEKYCLTYCHE
jgi:hypothetical protein